jgi:hypothetical protein
MTFEQDELERYESYLDWVREHIDKAEKLSDTYDLGERRMAIDIYQIEMIKNANESCYKIYWNIDGQTEDTPQEIGMLLIDSYPDWVAEQTRKKRDERIDEVLS